MNDLIEHTHAHVGAVEGVVCLGVPDTALSGRRTKSQHEQQSRKPWAVGPWPMALESLTLHKNPTQGPTKLQAITASWSKMLLFCPADKYLSHTQISSLFSLSPCVCVCVCVWTNMISWPM